MSGRRRAAPHGAQPAQDRATTLALTGGFAGLILLVDMVTPVNLTVPVLYALLLPVLGHFDLRLGPPVFAAGVAALSALGALVSPDTVASHASLWIDVFINRSLITVVVGGMALLYARSLRLQRELEQATRLDPLTGLLNQASLIESVTDDLARDRAAWGACVIVVADAVGRDRLAATLGPAAADAASVAIANACRGGVPQPARLGRLADGRIAVALMAAAADQAEVFAAALQRHVGSQPILVGGELVALSVEVGLATYREEEPIDATIVRASFRASADQPLPIAS